VITPSKTKAGQGWPGLLDLTGADELCAIFFVIPKGDMKGEWKQCAVKPFLALILISGASLVQLPVSARAQTPVTTVDPKLLALAKAGDTRSQLLLGYAYNKGEEAPLDLDEASAWYHKESVQSCRLVMLRGPAGFGQRQGGSLCANGGMRLPMFH